VFQTQQFSKHEVRIMEAGVALQERWSHGQQVDIMREMKGLTRQIISKMLFDSTTGVEVDEVGEAITLVLSQFSPFGSPLGDLMAKLPMSRARRVHKAQQALNGFVSRLVAKRRESSRTHEDIFSVLMSARDEPVTGQESDDQLIHDEVTTLFLAGHETTGTALGWTWYLLAKDQAVQAKLHAELDMVLGSRLPELADVPHLRYTKMVFAEAMRIYPPVWVLGRYLVEAFETGGYVLPAGSIVVISQYLMHHDLRFFPDPWRFDPERWTPEAKARRPQFSYFPFGGGPRGCVGEGLSWITGTLLIAALAQRWRMQLVQSNPIKLQPLLTLQTKNKILIRLERRDENASQFRTRSRNGALISNSSPQGCPAHD
jgi:cytochrome P450